MKEIKPEADLYPLVLRWLSSGFASSEAVGNLAGTSMIFPANISKAGIPEGGRWSRPDLAAIVYSRARYTPNWDAAIYSFEVKTKSNVNEEAVYEAFAHTRFSDYSYLLWQDDNQLSETSLKIVALCARYGVGAITSEDPSRTDTYRIRKLGSGSRLSANEFDAFVTTRIESDIKLRIEKWLSSQGWSHPNETNSRI